MAENAILRQLLIVLRRRVKRPNLNNRDRLRLILLSRCIKFRAQALHIIQPDTLLRWPRGLIQLFWRFKSRNNRQTKRTHLARPLRILYQMVLENRLRGDERIRRELLKPGITFSRRTIQKYIDRARKSPSRSRNWTTFLRNHASEIWACDFTIVQDRLFRPMYIFVIMALKQRRIVQIAAEKSPPDPWTAQQLREAAASGKRPRFLIRDRDARD